MTSRDHARRLMLILLANDRAGLRLDQDAPTAHRAARRDQQVRRAAMAGASGHADREGALARVA